MLYSPFDDMWGLSRSWSTAVRLLQLVAPPLTSGQTAGQQLMLLMLACKTTSVQLTKQFIWWLFWSCRWLESIQSPLHKTPCRKFLVTSVYINAFENNWWCLRVLKGRPFDRWRFYSLLFCSKGKTRYPPNMLTVTMLRCWWVAGILFAMFTILV